MLGVYKKKHAVKYEATGCIRKYTLLSLATIK